MHTIRLLQVTGRLLQVTGALASTLAAVLLSATGGGNLLWPYQAWIASILEAPGNDTSTPTLPQWGIAVLGLALIAVTVCLHARRRRGG